MERLRLWYQSVPTELRAGSSYLGEAARHGLAADVLRPDLVLRWDGPQGRKWLIVEAKFGDISFRSGRSVQGSARAALKDLLTYRTDFANVLDGSRGTYGLGLAWGADLVPQSGDVMLATPDRLGLALDSGLERTVVIR